jgi:hypothetical protein
MKTIIIRIIIREARCLVPGTRGFGVVGEGKIRMESVRIGIAAAVALAASARAHGFDVHDERPPPAEAFESARWSEHGAALARVARDFGIPRTERPAGARFESARPLPIGAAHRLGDPGEHFPETAQPAPFAPPQPGRGGGAHGELELRLALEHVVGDLRVALVPAPGEAVRGWEVDVAPELEYGIGLHGRWTARLEWRLEVHGGIGEIAAVGALDEQEHYVAPALSYAFGEGVEWNVGVAFGLTGASDAVVVHSALAWFP